VRCATLSHLSPAILADVEATRNTLCEDSKCLMRVASCALWSG
jgi:hypothetical protein